MGQTPRNPFGGPCDLTQCPLEPMKMGTEHKEAAAVNLLIWTNNYGETPCPDQQQGQSIGDKSGISGRSDKSPL